MQYLLPRGNLHKGAQHLRSGVASKRGGRWMTAFLFALFKFLQISYSSMEMWQRVLGILGLYENAKTVAQTTSAIRKMMRLSYESF